MLLNLRERLNKNSVLEIILCGRKPLLVRIAENDIADSGPTYFFPPAFSRLGETNLLLNLQAGRATGCLHSSSALLCIGTERY